jgi:threonine aldolase
MFCLSKGLGAPVGSMLCGGFDIIDKAKRYRKMLGGGMRQTGWICACGIEALSTQNIDRLKNDHNNAGFFAKQLNHSPEIQVDLLKVHTNFVNARFDSPRYKLEGLKSVLADKGILINEPKGHSLTFVVSRQVNTEDIQTTTNEIRQYLEREIP